MRELIIKGRQQKFVTHQEIESAMPNFEESIDLVDELMGIFHTLGIEVIDQRDAFVWRKDKPSTPEEEEAKEKQKERDLQDLAEISNDSVRMYLSEIGRVPLLSAQDEIDVAKRIDALPSPQISPLQGARYCHAYNRAPPKCHRA